MTKRRSLVRRLLSPALRRGPGLARDEHGAVAVEFAILAPVFFTVVFAILETALTFFAQQVLESALQDTTRLIRTGQSQSGSEPWNVGDFRVEICGRTFGLFDCSATNAATDRLRVKVTPIDSFSAAPDLILRPAIPEECTVGSTNPGECDWDFEEVFNDGTGNSVIIAQAFYKWPTLINLPWFSLANQAGNNRLLSAVRVFKNEPFAGASAATP